MIDAAEIEAIADWIDRRYANRDGAAVGEWFDARGVDAKPIYESAFRYTSAALLEDPDRQDPAAIASVFVLGFQLGLDAERRRRDREGLPA